MHVLGFCGVIGYLGYRIRTLKGLYDNLMAVIVEPITDHVSLSLSLALPLSLFASLPIFLPLPSFLSFGFPSHASPFLHLLASPVVLFVFSHFCLSFSVCAVFYLTPSFFSPSLFLPTNPHPLPFFIYSLSVCLTIRFVPHPSLTSSPSSPSSSFVFPLLPNYPLFPYFFVSVFLVNVFLLFFCSFRSVSCWVPASMPRIVLLGIVLCCWPILLPTYHLRRLW